MANDSVPKSLVFEPRSQAMRAMLIIAEESAVSEILDSILDVGRNEIHWEQLDYSVLSGGQKAALSWAWAIWTDGPVPHGWRDPFEGFGVMSAGLQRAVLRALLCRHGVPATHKSRVPI